MKPKTRASFEKMLTSFAYSPGTAATAASDVAVAGRTGKKRKKTEEDAMPNREKRSPAPPPQTPPRLLSRGRWPLALAQPDGTVMDDTTAAELPATMPRETAAGEAAAATTSSATAKGERRRPPRCGRLLTPACPHTRDCTSASSRVRKDGGGKPSIVSRFFRHRPSASTGGALENEQIELTDEGKGKRHVDANMRRKRTKRSPGGTSRVSQENKGEEHEARKTNGKKFVVVSPYFATPSGQRVPEGGADGVGEELEVVVQRRRTKKKRTGQAAESTAQATTTSGACKDRSKRVVGKRKRKRKHESIQLTPAERMSDAYKRVPDDNPWCPPFSDHELLQEIHFFDHWRVLVICMLLNRTTGRKVRKILPRLFLLCPDAKTTTTVSKEEIEELTKPLGLQKKRSRMIKRMSEEYLGPEWTHVTQLHGIGKYAADAYAIFCSGMWKDVKPSDHKLVDYWRFLLDDKTARESITVQKST